jgi:hypothetical protein
MGKKHKSYKIVALALAFVAITFGQTNNFEFVQYDTAYTGSEDFVVLHGDIFSLSNVEQSITVTRIEHQRPTTWVTSFCVGPACLPWFVDTHTFALAAGDTALFTLDTFPYGETGTGSWTIFAVDSSTMEVDSVHISMDFVTVSIDDSYARPQSFELSHVYPNPTNASVNFDLNLNHTGEYIIMLHSLDGREIMSRHYQLKAGKNHLQWSLQGLPSGNYIISATGSGETISRQVSVIK